MRYALSMFIRTKTTPNSPRKSVQIVESYRQGDRTRQRILRHIGIAEDDEHLRRLKDLATVTLAEMQQDVQLGLFSAEEEAQQISVAREALLAQRRARGNAQLAYAQQTASNPMQEEEALPVNLRQLREVSRVTVGFHEVYGHIYDRLGFNRLMGTRRGISGRVLRDMVLARLAQPASKLASAALLRRDFGIEIDEDQVYRMMDHLDEAMQARMQTLAQTAAFDLLGQKVDVMFFDCTTLYFESFEEDSLRQKGVSKDHKTAETQVLLALLVTREGLPIAYRLYPGSQWEGHTLSHALDDLRQLCEVDRVVLVADSALFSKDNLALMTAQGQPYIVAARLKNLPQAVTDIVLDSNRYHPLSDGESFLETTHLGQRLVVTYSEKRAHKDAHERTRAVERAQKRYHNKTVKSALKGYEARYLKVEEQGRVSLDEQRIQEAARWDGLHGILTNIQDLTVQDALAHYKGLWQIEETFRLSKHDLRIRPIFHWTAKRIQAHVALCFMALVCMRWVMYSCSLRYQPLSPEVIRNELAHVQVSILQDQKTARRFAIPAPVTKHAQQLFRMVGKTLEATPFELV